MDSNLIIIFICSIIILSYIFSILEKLFRIPSVLLLISAGILLRYIWGDIPLDQGTIDSFVQIFGTAGIIMIVLEASLELQISRDNRKLIIESFASSFFVLVISCLALALIASNILKIDFYVALIHMLPFSVISSAVVIPSIRHLKKSSKDFITYESAFSDILGVLFFNFLIQNESISLSSIIDSAGILTFLVFASFIASLILLYLLTRIKFHIRYFLFLAILFLLYSIGKIYHLPSLVLVMFFGLILKNFSILLFHAKLKNLINTDFLTPSIDQFKTLITEISFVIRTFFFMLFGFIIDLKYLLNINVIITGIIIIAVLIIIRYLYFRFIINTKYLLEIFLMPRGLITVLLFFSIPAQYSISFIDKGVLFVVILLTGILMGGALLTSKDKEEIFDDIKNQV